MLMDVCSSHKELPEQFTDTPYKVGMYVHYTQNYENGLLTLVMREIILMGREEHLIRKQDRFNGQRDTRID